MILFKIGQKLDLQPCKGENALTKSKNLGYPLERANL